MVSQKLFLFIRQVYFDILLSLIKLIPGYLFLSILKPSAFYVFQEKIESIKYHIFN